MSQWVATATLGVFLLAVLIVPIGIFTAESADGKSILKIFGVAVLVFFLLAGVVHTVVWVGYLIKK